MDTVLTNKTAFTQINRSQQNTNGSKGNKGEGTFHNLDLKEEQMKNYNKNKFYTEK